MVLLKLEAFPLRRTQARTLGHCEPHPTPNRFTPKLCRQTDASEAPGPRTRAEKARVRCHDGVALRFIMGPELPNADEKKNRSSCLPP